MFDQIRDTFLQALWQAWDECFEQRSICGAFSRMNSFSLQGGLAAIDVLGVAERCLKPAIACLLLLSKLLQMEENICTSVLDADDRINLLEHMLQLAVKISKRLMACTILHLPILVCRCRQGLCHVRRQRRLGQICRPAGFHSRRSTALRTACLHTRQRIEPRVLAARCCSHDVPPRDNPALRCKLGVTK